MGTRVQALRNNVFLRLTGQHIPVGEYCYVDLDLDEVKFFLREGYLRVEEEEVKTEEVKTEEVKTEEVKTEEVKTEEVKTEEDKKPRKTKKSVAQ